jgi:hypothetical protein
MGEERWLVPVSKSMATKSGCWHNDSWL